MPKHDSTQCEVVERLSCRLLSINWCHPTVPKPQTFGQSNLGFLGFWFLKGRWTSHPYMFLEQFMVFRVIEIWALCTPVKFFYLLGSRFVHRCIVGTCLEPLAPVKGKTTAYKAILCNCVLPSLWQPFGQEPYADVMYIVLFMVIQSFLIWRSIDPLPLPPSL